MPQSWLSLWTLDELSAQVALSLLVRYKGQASGRVREVPDRRTIRYYSTLGLLDEPTVWWARTALYGPRHLAQLVAIKRLQAQGLTLAQVRVRLEGLNDVQLAELAQLPAQGEVREPAPAPLARKPDLRRLLTGLQLGDGVILLLDDIPPPDEHDLESMREAAAPLLHVLQARGLLAAGQGGATKGETP